VLVAEPAAHGEQGLVVRDENLPALGDVRLDVEAVGQPGRLALVRPPAGDDGLPRLGEALDDVAGVQVLGGVGDL
jgi:hypothetical protein